VAGEQVSADGQGRALDAPRVVGERLWRTFNYEEVYLHEYTSPRKARQHLAGYFQFLRKAGAILASPFLLS
jgi:putative transposase